MRIRDIVNRELVTLTNCEHEPIHIPGSIQPHGFLIGLSEKDHAIIYCSGNTEQYIGESYTKLLGKTVRDVAGKTADDLLRNYVLRIEGSVHAPLRIIVAGKEFNCVVQKNNPGVVIAEFESVGQDLLGVDDMYRQTKQFTSYMQRADSLQALCQSVADETRAVTGYDRVMIYRFDEDYNGEVFAESKIDEIEPFLGLHYPHTDIPVQARELYLKNLLRLIVDIDYTPVPIFTMKDGASHSDLDLSYSTLRSVSPIHVQYLQNMGVGATLTISLVHENRLWGMITCHHYSAKYLTGDVRIAAQLQGHFLSSQLAVRERAEEFELTKEVNRKLEALVKKTFVADTVSPQLILAQDELMDFVKADGIILLIEGELHTRGSLPPKDAIWNLIAWLQSSSRPSGFSTSRLSTLYPAAEDWCGNTSGLVYHPVGAAGRNCFILCRSELQREIKWAGNPEKAIEKNENGLSPRKSFALWKEIKRCESAPWLQAELLAISTFAHALERHVHIVRLSEEELRQRTLSQQLKSANEELENINWIGSHDLKEPLRKIQIFASRILDNEDDARTEEETLSYVRKMNASASRMQTLISDILAYSRVGHVDEAMAAVDLNGLLEEVSAEMQYELSSRNATLNKSDLPTINGVRFLLQQLFTNLLSNSLKFAREDIDSMISVTAEKVNMGSASDQRSFLKIKFSDNGIGFDEKYREQIFRVFKKLHSTSAYRGTGVGLALCKKIMHTHGGFIEAHGEPGKGASFDLYFPADQA